MTKRIFKNDKYQKHRGGNSRILEISCVKCETKIIEYQKDGPGSLKRMYIDRIHSPNKYIKLNSKALKDFPILKCENCKRLLGYPYLYKKEKRKCYRVFQDVIKKRIIKL
jgi:hypothetical protein